MGVWGPGNFDEDTAAGHLSGIAAKLVEAIELAMSKDDLNIEPDEYWGVAVPCNIEILALFAEQKWVGASVPDQETIAFWRARYMRVWREAIVGLAGDDFIAKRAAVLERTFDRLAAHAEPRVEAPPIAQRKKQSKPRKKP